MYIELSSRLENSGEMMWRRKGGTELRDDGSGCNDKRWRGRNGRGRRRAMRNLGPTSKNGSIGG
jgi:hypothetical protein